MKRLTATQIRTKQELARSLGTLASEITLAVQKINTDLAAARESIEALTGRYNELIQESNAFMASVNEQQKTFFDDHSDAWQGGDGGVSYQYWLEEWSNDLDELDEIALPDEIEEPEFVAADIFGDLPDQP